MSTELDRLTAARPVARTQPGDVVTSLERAQLVDMITATPRRVDDHLAEATVESANGSYVMPDRVTDARRRAPGRPVLALLATAVAAAAMAFGGVQLFGGLGADSNQAGSTSDARMLSLPFAVGPSSDVSIVSAAIFDSDGSQEDTLYGPGGAFTLDLMAGSERPNMSFDRARRVDVDGKTGYLACGAPRGTSMALSRCNGGQLAWHYASGRWATLIARRTSLGAAVKQVALLRIARGLDFSHRTRLLSPISIPEAPANTQLATWEVNYDVQKLRDTALSADDGWSISVSYQPTQGGNEFVDIDAMNRPLPTTQGRSIKVNGRAAVWSSSTHRLWLDAGHGVALLVSVDHPSSLDTLGKITALARSIAVASEPGNRKSWFDVRHALP